MKPVRQTKDNCMAACWASILEVPLDAVPDYQGIRRAGGSWLNVINTWLSKHHGVVYVETERHVTPHVRPEGWHLILIGVPEDGDGGHAIVGLDGHPIWDPVGGFLRNFMARWKTPDAWGVLVKLTPALRATWEPTWTNCICPACTPVLDAVCIYCGCSDSRACADGCGWRAVDRLSRIGVCTRCVGTEDEAYQVLASLGADQLMEAVTS